MLSCIVPSMKRVIAKENVLLCLLGAFAKLRKRLLASSYVSPFTWKNSAPTGRFFIKFDIWGFSKISRGNTCSIKIGQLPVCRVLHTKSYLHLWYCPTELYATWKMFLTNVVEKGKIHILCSIIFYLKVVPFLR
jgi:hypothetical protein